MKKINRMLNWILLSIICQVALLSYFNFYYLNRSSDAKATLINLGEDKPKKVQTIDVPQNAKDIKVSYDNTFISYILDGKIEIKKIADKETVKTISYKTDQISYYRWLPDRNMIIYGLKAPDAEAGRVQAVTYNVDTEAEHNYPKITGLPKKSSIEEIELSPLTNVVYVKVLTGGESAKIYRYNVMSELSSVMSLSDKSVIKEFTYDNKFAYRDEKYKLYVWDGLKSSKKLLEYSGKLDLLGICGIDDEIYVSLLDDSGKAKEVLYGTIDKPVSSWEKIKVETPVAPERLYLSPNGDLYEMVTDKKMVSNLKTSKKSYYNGQFLELFNNHIVSIENNKVKIELISE